MNLAQRLLTSAAFVHPPVRIIDTTAKHYFRSTIMTQSSTNLGPLNFQAGPLVWIDCEMTGLNPKRDKLLEIAVIITNGNLDFVDEGIQFVIKREKSIMDNMHEWCIEQHGKSGLTKACLESPYDKDYVSNEVLQYIKKWIPEQRVGVLAGSSVHADRSFLVEEMPEIVDWLHYRIVDVSSIKELCRRWYPGAEAPTTILSGRHRALEDIRGSIRELAWYREKIFRTPAEIIGSAK